MNDVRVSKQRIVGKSRRKDPWKW